MVNKCRQSQSRFFCISCGQEGMPIWRKVSKQHKAGHMKGLYCIRCRMVINHYEAKTDDDVRRFRERFEAGEFKEAAAESVEFAKREGL